MRNTETRVLSLDTNQLNQAMLNGSAGVGSTGATINSLVQEFSTLLHIGSNTEKMKALVAFADPYTPTQDLDTHQKALTALIGITHNRTDDMPFHHKRAIGQKEDRAFVLLSQIRNARVELAAQIERNASCSLAEASIGK